MRTYHMAHGTCSVLCGDLDGKRIQREWINVYLTHFAVWQSDSRVITLQSNYTPIKINFKKTEWEKKKGNVNAKTLIED